MVARRTARGADNDGFFIGNRGSHWLLVAFGMVGTSLSGVTFISVPGAVGATAFTYFQTILGHLVGYVAIAFVRLPLYCRTRVTSIYHYLGKRLGPLPPHRGCWASWCARRWCCRRWASRWARASSAWASRACRA